MWEEIEYTDLMFSLLMSVAEYKGGSLHCDEWIADYGNKLYRLLECGSGDNKVKSIDVWLGE